MGGGEEGRDGIERQRRGRERVRERERERGWGRQSNRPISVGVRFVLFFNLSAFPEESQLSQNRVTHPS